MSEPAGFLTPLRLEKIGPQRWLLIDDLRYRTQLLNGIFVVPRGFQTDLASIPRLFWVIAPKVDIYDAAAVLHDAAYASAVMTRTMEQRVFLAKEWADRIFLEAMLALGVPAWRASAMYHAVRLFGDFRGHPLAANRQVQRA